MRIAIHDYAGHPFQFDLSRALARLGHDVRHFYFAGDAGPKGQKTIQPDDPAGFSIEAIHIPFPYTKDRMLHRFLGDQFYANAARRRIARFRPDLVISGNAPIDVQAALRSASHKCGAKFIFWVQDLYGLAIRHLIAQKWMGLGWLISEFYLRKESRTLKRSDEIILISPGFKQYLPPLHDDVQTRPYRPQLGIG